MITVDDYVEVIPYCSQGDQAALNVLHFRCSATVGGPFAEQDVANAFRQLVASKYVQLINAQAYFNGVTFRKWLAPGWGGYYYAAVAVQGTSGTNALPRQSTGLISWRTSSAGRAGRGRSYVPFPSEEHNGGDSLPTADYMDKLNQLASTLQTTGAMIITGANVATFKLQVYNRTTATFREVDHNVQPKKWATQRRRGSFGRPNRIPDGLIV